MPAASSGEASGTPEPDPRRPRPERRSPGRPEDSTPARWVAAFSVAAFFALIWPIYPLFADIEPMVLGMPFSLAYLVIAIAVVFGVMMALFIWEDRNDRLG